MAQSRRRERELARRRFERRRLAAMQAREAQRKRNTTIGAVVGVLVVLAAVIVVGVLVIGGGSSTGKKSVASTPTTGTSIPPTTATSPATTTAAPTKCAKITPDPTAKGQPVIPQVTGKLTNKLVVKTVKEGTGPAAKTGATLSVDYIGVSCDSGQVFDATYKDGGTPFSVTPLGTASVITGWNNGLIGIKKGEERELIIPGAQAYGSAGSGSTIPPNDTLVFLVTALSVKN